ncbi:MAG: hypothetical protein J1D77_04070 [Muribaculaceae bacterium]|nr:hypothetical protein [Muribaculaceae bacterium]
MRNLLANMQWFWRAHVSNWLWRPREMRKAVRKEATLRRNLAYLQKYIPFIQSLNPHSDVRVTENHDYRAFTIWLQGLDKSPQIVKTCIDSMKEFFGEKLIVLDSSSIPHYVDIPEFIVEKKNQGKISNAHFSDFLRIELLFKYGGYWFDATDFLLSTPPEEISRQDFFMYIPFPILEKPPFVENYFIRAKAGNPLLGMWRDLVMEYWRLEDKAYGYFLVQSLFKLLVTYNGEAKRLFSQMAKINRDVTLKLWNHIGNDEFDPEKVDRLKKEAFFQKCSYKNNVGIVREIIKGSIAHHVLNSPSLQ